MTETDYLKILEHLDAASQILRSNKGDAVDGDIRIRHLVSISAAETKRQLAQCRRDHAATRASAGPIESSAAAAKT